MYNSFIFQASSVQESSPFGTPQRRSSNNSIASLRSGIRKRSSKVSIGEPEQPLGGFAYLDSDEDAASNDSDLDRMEGISYLALIDIIAYTKSKSLFLDNDKVVDETESCDSIRMTCFKKMSAEIRETFPVLFCMVTLLEASSVAGALPVETLLGGTAPVMSGADMLSGVGSLTTNNLMSAPAALLKGLFVYSFWYAILKMAHVSHRNGCRLWPQAWGSFKIREYIGVCNGQI